MREKTKRSCMTCGAVLSWVIAAMLTVAVVRGADPQPWAGFLPITVGAAVAFTVSRYLMRTQHIMAQVYRAGKDAESERRDDIEDIKRRVKRADD